MRSWSAGASQSGGEALPGGWAYHVDPAFSGTPELVFELPAVASLSTISAVATVPAAATVQLHFAVATNDRTAFTDVGTIELTRADQSGSLQGPYAARWLRVRIERPRGADVQIQTLTASGSVAVPHASFAGLWSPENVFGSDAFFGGEKGSIPDGAGTTGNYQIATMERDGSLVEATCVSYRDVNRGLIVDGTARLSGGGSLSVVGQGSLMVGLTPDGDRVFARRITHAPACGRARLGAGPTVAVIGRYPSQLADYDPRIAKGYRYETFMLPMLTTSDLQSARVAVLAMSCAGDKDAADWQQRALLDFVAGGRVLLVRDADLCSKSAYAFIPYPFTTAASGAGAARGSMLYVADSSALASNDRTDAQHYVDTAAYLKNYLQQLGDADVMQTNDAHWCGLMFAKNATGSSGWVRAYARYGKGLIIYDGFDADDRRAGIPQALALNRLAYNVSPGADLPCIARVAAPLALLSSVHETLDFGRSRDLTMTFSVVRQSAGAALPVTMSLEGERAAGWRSGVDRRAFTLATGAQPVHVTLHVPANATPTRHMYTLTATSSGGQSAQAAIVLDVSEPLAKELESSGRARIYGIHFDVGSAHIQPQSQSVIREIGLVLRDHPQWRMEVQGYTDSDGGAPYNLALSRHRAQAVVGALVARYGIARARLTPRGYGLTRPVASNATDAGKALNRRVELVRV